MLGTVDWIAIGLACVCGIGALVFWRSASEAKRRQQQLQRECEQLQLDLQNSLGEAEAIRRQLQELIDRPPLPADPHFAEHLSALGERIADRLLELDGARVSSAEPLRLAAEESEQSRVIERKKRFAGYRDTLFKANVEINGHVERLLDSHAAVLVVRDAVGRPSRSTRRTRLLPGNKGRHRSSGPGRIPRRNLAKGHSKYQPGVRSGPENARSKEAA